MEQPTLPFTIEGDWLICPFCNGSNLHYKWIEVYSRDSEDCGFGSFVRIDGARDIQMNTDATMEANPSVRRSGLRLVFFCKGCDPSHPAPVPSLVIAQDKGATYIKWEVPGGIRQTPRGL